MAKIHPIHKFSQDSNPANYTPIFILPIVFKDFVKYINTHAVAFLNKYKLIHINQLGYKQNHSCQTAIAKFLLVLIHYVPVNNCTIM